MILFPDGWAIDTDTIGYKVGRPFTYFDESKGKERTLWKLTTYHARIDAAILRLLDNRIRDVTSQEDAELVDISEAIRDFRADLVQLFEVKVTI